LNNLIKVTETIHEISFKDNITSIIGIKYLIDALKVNKSISKFYLIFDDTRDTEKISCSYVSDMFS